MKGLRVGYIRVSAEDQNPERQLQDIPLDKRFIEMASGKDTNRPQLKMMMDFVREGDTVVVHSLDRLARNLHDLRTIVNTLVERSVHVEFVKEHMTFTGDDSPMSIMILSMMGAYAEFERSIIRERQAEGIALAKKKGIYKGRKRSLTPEQVLTAKERVRLGISKSRIARDLNVSRKCIYNYLQSA